MSGRNVVLPDLKRYIDKHLMISLNGSRKVKGQLRGYDQFLNLVLDNTIEEVDGEKHDLGMVVIRGNSVLNLELVTYSG